MTNAIQINWTEVEQHAKKFSNGDEFGRGRIVDSIEEVVGISNYEAQDLFEGALSDGAIRDVDGWTYEIVGDADTGELGETVDIDESDKFAPHMKSRNQWLVRSVDDKLPRAPWKQGNCYPCEWNDDLDDRPEVNFEKAQRWASEQKANMVESLSWPDGETKKLRLAYFLPYEPSDEEVMLVDFDDVRDPETGDVHPKALDLLEELDTYAEVSQSGEGIHAFPIARLPEQYDSGVKVELDDEPFVGEELPEIEFYHRKRAVAITGNHIQGTPHDCNERQSVVDQYIDEHTDDEEEEVTEQDTRERVFGDSFSSSNDSERSPYYSVPSRKLVNTSGGNWTKTGSEFRGPHPAHGSSTGNNSAVECDGDMWHCFRHETGGNALMLIATKEGLLDCENCESGALGKLDDQEFAKLCLMARDDYGFGDDWKPPYRALVGVAKSMSLAFESKSEDKLGSNYSIAKQVYDNMTASDM